MALIFSVAIATHPVEAKEQQRSTKDEAVSAYLERVANDPWNVGTVSEVDAWFEYQLDRALKVERLRLLKAWIEFRLCREEYEGVSARIAEYKKSMKPLIKRGHADTLSIYLYEGWLAQAKGKWDEAKEKFFKAFEVKEAQGLLHGKEVAWLSERMAVLLIEIGFYDAAEEMMQESLRIWKEAWGTSFPHYCRAEQQMLEIQEMMQDPRAAGHRFASRESSLKKKSVS